MSYFNKFPRVNYSFDNGDNTKTAVDIVKRVKFRDYIKENSEMFVEYQLRDGDTPDIVADKVYGDSKLHWVIMLLNDVTNPYYDWALSQQNLEAYAFNKYRGETYFLTDWSTEDALPSNFEPVRNDTIMGVSGSGVDPITNPFPYNADSAALVRRWDKTQSKLEVIGITGDGFTNGDYIVAIGTSADGSTYNMSARISRKVSQSISALHHFENSVDGTVLNPLGSAPQGVTGLQAIIGNTGGISGPGAAAFDFYENICGFTSTLLYGYIVNDSNTYVKTNFDHEDSENEVHRTIKLVRPEYIQRIIEDFETLMGR
jgi:hypothetical protein